MIVPLVVLVRARVHRAAAPAPRARWPRQAPEGGGPVSRWLRSFGVFWYDFIVGDDWRGAAAVALALAATALLVHAPG